MKIGFVFGSPKISGGSYVIFQHAVFLKRRGHDVHILLAKKNEDLSSYRWHEAFDLLKFDVIDEFREKLDIVIATWWESPYLLWKIQSKQYAYFVQSIEAYFFNRSNIANQYIAHQSYFLDLPIITEATWIQEDLISKYVRNVFLVKNGILKNRYKPDGYAIDLPAKGKLRCLVEGPVNVPFKAVNETIKALKKSKADEVWLLTSSDIDRYDGCDRVFSNIDPTDVPLIMRSCDLIVKQSAVEGMFGPPLEMFHCGGTAVVSNVTGFDEYIIDGKNALVNNIWDFETVTKNINKLKEKPLFLNELKRNALITAENWPDWNCQSEKFENTLLEIMKLPKVSREELLRRTKLIYKFADYLRKSTGSEKTVANLPVRFEMPKDRNVFFQNEMKFKTKNKIKRILGLTISNEHIQEIWHPLIERLGLDYKYICTKNLNEYTLWDRDLANRSAEQIDKDSYLTFNWINQSNELFKQIESFAPDVILVHSGNHPAYQRTLVEINRRYQIPILFTELGWLPQRYNFYIDELGSNAKSSISKKTFREFIGSESSGATSIDFSKKNVLLILQLETDMNFLLNNKYFKSNEEFISYVIKAIPNKYNVIIKPHPLDNNSDRYSIFESERVSVCFDSFESVVVDCNSVIGINSTCLIEALQYDVNVYKCGESILDNKELVIEFTNENLNEVWKDCFVNNKKDRALFLEELRNHQVPVNNLENLTEDDVLRNKSIQKLLNAEYLELYDFQAKKRKAEKKGNRLICTSLENLCQGLLQYDVISFDFFDTLISYETLKPIDIHRMMSIKVCEIVKSNKFDHFTYRTKAESIVRSYTLADEISIDEIYAQYLLMTGLSASLVNEIKKKEIECIKTLTSIRHSGKKLFDFAKSFKKKVCITSDFYIGEGFIKNKLENSGFDVEGVDIYVSVEVGKSKKNGSLYDHLLSTYNGKKIIHIGDNFKIDLQTALDSGIDACHFPSSFETQKNSTKSLNYLEFLFGSQVLNTYSNEMGVCLAKIINNRFDDPFKIDKTNNLPLGIYDVGYSLLGPIIYSFTEWLTRKAKEKNINHLLFLSRDGFLLKKAFDCINNQNSKITSNYVYCSRRAMNIINLSYNFSAIKEIVDTRLSKAPLSYFFEKRLNLDTQKLDVKKLKGTGFNSFEDSVQLPSDKSRLMLVCQKYRREIQDESLRMLNNYKKYLKKEILKEGLEEQRIGIVDIGYFGSMQSSLNNILNDLGGCLPEGFYLATRKEIEFNSTLSTHCHGFFAEKFAPTDHLLPSICRRLGYLEFLLSAPHGSFESLDYDNEELKIFFTDSQYEKNQWDRLEIIHDEALNFIRDLFDINLKLKKLGIRYFDPSKIRFDEALYKFLDPTNNESREILKGFILENLYSLEIIPFFIDPKSKVEPIKISGPVAQKNIGSAAKSVQGDANRAGNSIVTASIIREIRKPVELANSQKMALRLYKPFLRLFASEKFYNKFISDPVKFFYDTKSRPNQLFALFVNKLGKEVFVLKNFNN